MCVLSSIEKVNIFKLTAFENIRKMDDGQILKHLQDNRILDSRGILGILAQNKARKTETLGEQQWNSLYIKVLKSGIYRV